MNCQNQEKNSNFCTCSYDSCPRRGICCECVQYHLKNDELPGCFFPPEAEKTYNRSRQYYLSVNKNK